MRRLAALALPLLVLAGCSGMDIKGALPDSMNKVCIPVFENRSGQSGIEQDFTQKVVRAVVSDGRLMVTDRAKADGQLSGVIQQYQKIVLLRDENQVAQQYKLVMAVDITLRDLKENKDLWTTHRMVEVNDAQGAPTGATATSSAFDSTNVSTLTEYTTFYVLNKLGMPAEDESTACNRVEDQLVQRILNRVLYGF